MGFLSDAQVERVLSVTKKYGDRFERVERRTGGLTIPEDAKENQRLFAEMMSALGQIISPSELEEGELRMMSVIGHLFSGDQLKEAQLTGTELRHLTKLKMQTANPLLEELSKFDGKESAPRIAAHQEFLREAREYLGENRFQQYLRAHDSSFGQLCAMTEKNGLRPQIAMGVFEIQQTALLESARIREDNTLLRRVQRLELESMQQSTQEAIQRLLGEKAAANYSTNGGNWLKEIGNP